MPSCASCVTRLRCGVICTTRPTLPSATDSDTEFVAGPSGSTASRCLRKIARQKPDLIICPIFFLAQWSSLMEARIMASTMLFWIVEDYLWFVINPAFGRQRFRPEFVARHHHWALGAPVDYWLFSALSAALFWVSY